MRHPAIACTFASLVLGAGLPTQLESRTPNDSAPQSTDTMRYVVHMGGNVAGTHLAWTASNGKIHARFEYNDRGRGPSLEQSVTVNSDGIPTEILVTGNDYLKSPVEERFTWADDQATWKSEAENGARQISGRAFYTTLNSTPEDAALLVRALLNAPDGKLGLLPAGEAWVEHVGELEVESGGERLIVEHYAVNGLGFQPMRVWLDRDRQLFARITGWVDVVHEGWAAIVPQLTQAQKEADAQRTRSLARTLSLHPENPIAFTGANLFDAPAAELRSGMTIVVSGDRITAVGPDGSVAIPQDARRIDATGKTVMPGLWDMHTHLGTGEVDGLLNIAAGVTTVRDLANDIDDLLEARRRFDEGAAIGPRVVMAGFMDGPGPFAGPTRILVDTPEEVYEAVDRYAELGYEQIKAYSSIKTELVPVIAERTHSHGMRLSGHIPAYMTAAQAVEQGYDEIQHINMIFLNFLGDTLDTRTPVRFIAVAQHGPDLDLASDSVRDFIALLKERDIVIDPTLSIFEQLFVARPGVMAEGDAIAAPRLPPQVRRGFLTGGLPVPEGMDARYRAAFAATLDMVRTLHEAGVRIVAGTDNLAGFALHRELELYSQAAIPNAEVLRIATYGAAQVTSRTDRLGSLAPGMLADLILVDGNPVADISDVRRVELVIKDGVLYDPAAIYRALGVTPWQEAQGTRE